MMACGSHDQEYRYESKSCMCISRRFYYVFICLAHIQMVEKAIKSAIVRIRYSPNVIGEITNMLNSATTSSVETKLSISGCT